jgi:hypothetical protein
LINDQNLHILGSIQPSGERSTGRKKLIRKLEKPRRKEMLIDINDSSKKFNMK